MRSETRTPLIGASVAQPGSCSDLSRGRLCAAMTPRFLQSLALVLLSSRWAIAGRINEIGNAHDIASIGVQPVRCLSSQQ